MTKPLSIGKYRALQQASNAKSIFTILAIDHQDSLRRALNPQSPSSVTDDEMVNFKRRVVSSLWNEAISGVLLDPVYGLVQLVEQGLPASVGLLAELEKADYNMNPLPLAVDIRPNWSVAKIKHMGANGVKLFYYYDPENAELCQQQDATLQQVIVDSQQHDIPLYAEPIIANVTPDHRQSKVIQSAKRTDELGADILKLEFPVDVHTQTDRQVWTRACEELTRAVDAPWVLLSAGVSFELFCEQVEIACQAGASGFMVGRAVWGDACSIKDEAQLDDWLKTIGRDRIRRLIEIANDNANPWTSNYHLNNISTDWYVEYPDFDE